MIVSCAVIRIIKSKQRRVLVISATFSPRGIYTEIRLGPTFRLIPTALLELIIELLHLASFLGFQVFELLGQGIPFFRPSCEL